MTDISNSTDSVSPAGIEPGLGKLILRGTIMALLLAAAMLAVLVLVPDGNDYARAAQLKEDRLMSLPGSRIVMIGGSNLSYGIDSPLVKSITGCPVVNMGMNGYFGVRFMLAEAEAGLRGGDVAVIALEYDSFVKSVDGTGTDLLMVGKTVPQALAHMTVRQLVSAASQIPFVVQSKVGRLADELVQSIHDAVFGGSQTPAMHPDLESIESFVNFTAEGDSVGHLDVKWPLGHEDGMDLTRLPVEPDLLPLIRDFSQRMKTIGVDVVFSYTPVMRKYYSRHKEAIDRIGAQVRRDLAGVALVPSSPDAFVYDDKLFFDTVYHLGREGRELRSRLVAGDILDRESGSDQCRGVSFSATR